MIVAAGGTAGTAMRYPLGDVIGDVSGIPVGILVVNVTGALVLGGLVASVARWVRDSGRRRRARLLWGTGLLGGYTTYSAFSLGLVELAHSGRFGAALVCGLGTVIAGTVATSAGIWLIRTVGGRDA